MLPKLDNFTNYFVVFLLINLVVCKPNRNFWDIIGEEIGEDVTGKPEEIGKYEEKLCGIDNIQCYDCTNFLDDEKTCRGISYCWFNCLTKECLNIANVAPNKFCSTYCQECFCLADNKCTWDPVDGLCISAQCRRRLPFDKEKHCHYREVDKFNSAFVTDGNMCDYIASSVVGCPNVRWWNVGDDTTAINIGSNGQFQVTFKIWPADYLPEDIQTYYLSFNGLQFPVKYPKRYAGNTFLYYLHFTVENGQPNITGFVNTKPLEPLQDKTQLSLSISSNGNCELGKIRDTYIRVFQLPEHWKCSGYRGDPCQCQHPLSDCRYIHSTMDCVPMEYIDDGWPSNRYACASALPQEYSYLVKRHFIDDGGRFYREDDVQNNGECKIQETVIAVNINGAEFTDTNGITHEAGSAVAPDDSTDAEFEAGDSTTSKCPVFTLAEPREVYGRFVKGKISSKDDLGRCLRYGFTVTQDGLYTLNVKFFDIDFVPNYYDRMFDIKLNNIVVAGGLKPFQLMQYFHCYPVDINIYFEVANGLSTVKITSDNTIPDWRISSGEMTVGFCNSPCEGNSGFVVSAFSVARYTFTKDNWT